MLTIRLRSIGMLFVGLIAAVGVGAATVRDPKLGAAAAAVTVFSAGLSLGSRGVPRALVAGAHRWIPLAWLAMLLISDHDFSARSPLAAAAGSASISNAIELVIYVATGLSVAATWAYFRPRNLQFLGSKLPFLWVAFAIGSAVWSIISVFTLVRALQLLVPLSLAVAMAGAWRSSPSYGEFIWTRSFRLLVAAVTLLVAVGLVSTTGLGGRFAWPYIHPTQAGVMIGAALIALLAGGRSFTKFSPPVYWTQVVLLSGALFLTRTRTALAAVAVGLLVALWLAGRRDVLIRYLGIAYYVGCGVVIWLVAQGEVSTYLTRGQDTQGVTSLTGRIPLWTLAIEEVRLAGNWLEGFGYGSSRVILFTQVDWAGTAHSAWIEILLGMGLIGVVLAAIGVFYLGYRLLVARNDDSSQSNPLAGALFVLLLVGSITQPGFALPGFEFTLMAMLYGYVLAHFTKSAMSSRPRQDNSSFEPHLAASPVVGR